jgi:type I restriction enzyme S subunit
MARLGDVCEIVSGTTPKSNRPEYWDGEINWITPAEIDDDTKVIFESQRKITEQAVKDSHLKPFPAGTVILSSRAPIGKVAIAGTEMYCNQGFKNLICSECIDNTYLFWFLKSKTEYLNSLGRGATFKEISKSIVEEIEIPLPPLNEQRRIAAILDKVTGLIALRKQQLAKLDELVRARFVEMFGDLTLNPYGWKFQPLSALCDVRDGTHDSPAYVTDGYPLLTSKNFSSGVLDFSGANLISKNDFDKINQRSKVDKGDIVMPMIGTIGHPVIIDTDIPFAIKNVALIKFSEPGISNTFIRCILDSNYFLQTVQTANRGGTQKFISLGDIRKFPIPIIPHELQKKFFVFSEKVNAYIQIINQYLEMLEIIKLSLIQSF